MHHNKIVQHGKITIWTKNNTKNFQYKKSLTWNECIMKWVQHREKGTIWIECDTEKNEKRETQKKQFKNVQHEIVEHEKKGIIILHY